MLTIRSLLFLLVLVLPGLAVAQPGPAPPSDFGQRIDVAQLAWEKAMLAEPPFVSLGAFPDWRSADVELTSILRERLKVIDRKVFSNHQWREHWTEQEQTAAELESLYAEAARTAPDARVRRAATARQASAREWSALAKDKTANQDAFLISLERERESIGERLEGVLSFAARSDEDGRPAVPALLVGATPFEERAARIAALRFRQATQTEERSVAVLHQKLMQQQVESGALLQVALKRDVGLALEESRIAAAQLSSSDPFWSSQWRPIAEAAAAKAEKVEQELQLGVQRQHSSRFDVSFAESQIAYRDQKSRELEGDREEAEAFSGWLHAALATFRERAPRVVGTLLAILLVGRLALWLLALVRRAMVKMAEDDGHVSAAEQRASTIASVLKGVGQIAVYLVGGLVALDAVGVDTTPLLGSVAILGLALSFGAQNLVRDFVNGFFILVENQYAVGDWVKIGAHEGDVEQIDIRSTRLRSVTGVLQIIPNGTITTVENMTRDWATFRCEVGVSYDTDVDLVERICNEVGAQMYADPDLEEKLLEAPSFVGVTELGDSAVVVRSEAKTQPGAQWSLHQEMNRRLKKAFEQAGIEIPFPQRVVWYRTPHPVA